LSLFTNPPHVEGHSSTVSIRRIAHRLRNRNFGFSCDFEAIFLESDLMAQVTD
jgi:hypothetical protein